MAKQERTYLGMRAIFLKHFLRGSVKCLPVLGNLLDEITFGVLEKEAARAESAKIHAKLDRIIKEHDQQQYDLAEILAGLHVQSDLNQQVLDRLKEIEQSLRDETNAPFPEYFGKALEKVLSENKQILDEMKKLSDDHRQQEEQLNKIDKKTQCSNEIIGS